MRDSDRVFRWGDRHFERGLHDDAATAVLPRARATRALIDIAKV